MKKSFVFLLLVLMSPLGYAGCDTEAIKDSYSKYSSALGSVENLSVYFTNWWVRQQMDNLWPTDSTNRVLKAAEIIKSRYEFGRFAQYVKKLSVADGCSHSDGAELRVVYFSKDKQRTLLFRVGYRFEEGIWRINTVGYDGRPDSLVGWRTWR